MLPRLRSFRSRVVFAFLVLLALVQVVGFLSVHSVTTHNARQQARGDVVAAASTFDSFIDLRSKRLTEGARLLASDFAFKTALSTADQATIHSTLLNHGARIGADLEILVANGRILADTMSTSSSARASIARRLVEEIDNESTGGLALFLDNRVYQVVVVPVLAPTPVAWLAVGLVIDDRLARQFGDMTRTELSVASEPSAKAWHVFASTLPPDLRSVVATNLSGAATATPFSMLMERSDYVTLLTPVRLSSKTTLVATLQRSLDDASRGLHSLRTTVTLFLAIGLIGSLVAGALIGRAVSRPVERLVESVRRIEQGNYSERIERGGSDELGELGHAVNEMATAIEGSRSALQRKVVESTALYQIARSISRQMDLDGACRHIVETARTLMAAEAATLVFYRAANGQPLSISAPEQTPVTDEIVRAITAYATMMPVAATIERYDVGSDSVSVLILPMRQGRLRTGALAVARPKEASFAEDEVHFLGALTDLATVALENDALDAEIRANAAELEATVEKRTKELERASQHKSDFLANMSHELRTPLTAIIGFSRVVMRRSKDVLPARQQENLEKILLSAEHLLALINNILDLSKIEAGHVEMQPEPFALAPLIDECLRVAEPLTAPEQLQLVRDVDPDLPSMYSDEAKVRQILINLVNNAIKFTESGTVTVTARRQGPENVEILVSDTGIGIPTSALALIFDKFRQMDTGVRRQYGGTGLGLSISRELARLLGGDIGVVSEVGAGTTFRVTLPVVYVASAREKVSGA